MEAYAVIQTGGKQYRVKQNDVVDLELLGADEGAEVKIEDVLAVSDGSALTIGRPHVDGASVTVEIVEQRRGKKVTAFKKKRRKGYHRKVGHRQELHRVRVKEIQA
mgnify:CR=1 FL=1